MGSAESKEEGEKTENKDPVFDPRCIYWDEHGHLMLGANPRDRGEELLKMLMTDNTKDCDLWVIVPSRWIRLWLLFAHLKKGDAPGEIDTTTLLVKDKSFASGWRPKKTLLPPKMAADKYQDDFPGHYRRVTKEAWDLLIEMYGVKGPAIAVWGAPEDDKSRWGIFNDPTTVTKDLLEAPVEPEGDEVKEEGGVASLFTSMFGSK